MSIGRSFEEALMKGWRSIGQGTGYPEIINWRKENLEKKLHEPNDQRLTVIWNYLKRRNSSPRRIQRTCELTGFQSLLILRSFQ
jgi:hypothetical protein